MPAALPRRCIFCGGSPLTLEHAWPRWLVGLIFRGVTGQELSVENSDIPTRVWRSRNPSFTVKRTCATCNNGWMSRLESVVQPLITPMVLGRPRNLTDPDQAAVSLWTVKTAALLQFTDPRRQAYVPSGHLTTLYRRQRAPAQDRIWLAGYRGVRIELRYWGRSA